MCIISSHILDRCHGLSMGQRSTFTWRDANKINVMYGCSKLKGGSWTISHIIWENVEKLEFNSFDIDVHVHCTLIAS